LKLSGLFVESNLDTTYAAIVYLHGIGGAKEHYLGKAEEMANQGYASMLVDLRAHGHSEGDYITYGYSEVDDVKRFTKAAKLLAPKCKLGIWGQSLGGAISLQIMAADTLIDFGIIESTYTTFDEIVYSYSKRYFKINLGWFNDYVIWRAQSLASFDKTGIHPIDACKKVKQPVLLVHGDQDKRISIDFAHANFDALACTDKKLLIVEGANHVNVWNTGGAKYKNNVLTFIKKNQ
jgi:alpha-beta hydrolase superfamily lysophospholipase